MRYDRYSRTVRALKVLFPTAAVLLVLAVFLFPRSLLIEDLGLSGVSFDPSEGLRLLAPRFTGTTQDGEPYALSAEWALPDAPDPTHIGLGPLVGEVRLNSGEVLHLTANAGEFRPKSETLDLGAGVVLRTDGGYRLEVSSAHVDIAAEALRATGPVEGSGEAGSISAGSMRMERRDGGSFIWFEDGVRVIVTPGVASMP